MLRIGLDADAAMRIRFGITPLGQVSNLMIAIAQDPASVPVSWRSRYATVVRERELHLLASLAPPQGYCYCPDFLEPEGATVEDGLHAVATTQAERIRQEIVILTTGYPAAGIPARRTHPIVMRTLDKGERHFAERAARELHELWTGAFAPRWPRLRARLERDVSHRADIVARSGLAAGIESVSEQLTWHDGAVVIHDGKRATQHTASGLILSPGLFHSQPAVTLGRTPVLYYQAARDEPSSGLTAELVGVTRARILAQLRQPQTTTELATQLYLSPGTVSYHLQILHRAGLVRRNRASHRVLYQAI